VKTVALLVFAGFASLWLGERLRWNEAAAFALALIAAGAACAQGAVSGVPNAMQGFSQNRDQPIQIEAASVEPTSRAIAAWYSEIASSHRPCAHST